MKANVPVNETPAPTRRLSASERLNAYKRLVDFVNKKKDRKAVVMAAMGCFSTNHIASKTGMSAGQAYYRFKKGGVSMRDTRNGHSPFVEMLMASAYEVINDNIESHLLTHVPNLYEIANMRNGHNGHNGHGHNGSNGHGTNGHRRRR